MTHAEADNCGKYGPQRLTVELTDICNLHCSYCLRDEDALYGRPAHYLPLEFLLRVIREARDGVGVSQVNYTGGEATLHPQFSQVLFSIASEGVKQSFVTNGWNFEKIWPAVLESRDSISLIAFSLDGATPSEHDRWRGAGSFVRLVKAFARCQHAGVPFAIKVGLRRDTVEQLEMIALFAARAGAARLNFSHVLPTSAESDKQIALNADERADAEREIAALARIFKMNVGIDVGYFNIAPETPCSPLAGTSCNIDYRGRLTLCCNLSGFRGAAAEEDVVADLQVESFTSAHARLLTLARLQMKRREAMLEEAQHLQESVDIHVGSPCLLCLQSFGKIPWKTSLAKEADDRALPVLTANR
jgi:MoaA/NifB/PqqE/SkfB family radical SAM enzyme